MLDHVGPSSLIAVLDMAALARAGTAAGTPSINNGRIIFLIVFWLLLNCILRISWIQLQVVQGIRLTAEGLVFSSREAVYLLFSFRPTVIDSWLTAFSDSISFFSFFCLLHFSIRNLFRGFQLLIILELCLVTPQARQAAGEKIDDADQVIHQFLAGAGRGVIDDHDFTSIALAEIGKPVKSQAYKAVFVGHVDLVDLAVFNFLQELVPFRTVKIQTAANV